MYCYDRLPLQEVNIMIQDQTLNELTEAILSQMELAGFTPKTRWRYRAVFHRLNKLAVEKGESHYTNELGAELIADDTHISDTTTKRYQHERTGMYARCVRMIESYLRDGIADLSPMKSAPELPLESEAFNELFQLYLNALYEDGLKSNTIDGYRRFVHYFLEFLESKGYRCENDICAGDVVTFITVICSEHYQPTSLGSHMPGLKRFLMMNAATKKFVNEIPEHLPKKRNILQIYSDDEYERILDKLETDDSISFRNKAITLIALDTGLRAVDICGMKLSDIDWEHDCIYIEQSKTGRNLTLPLTERIGNALADYLLNERPVIESDYVFLKIKAPYSPLMSHAGIRSILFHAVDDADIKANGRIYGTRITRHSTASRMLRKGIPLPVISEMLGHNKKDSVMVYLTTDDARLAECTLPVPMGRCRK